MTTSSISSIGVGSGLPLDRLLNDLRANENRALSLIQSRYEATQNRISAYAALKNAVETVADAAEALEKENTLGALKAATTGNAYAASAGDKAIPGEYRITVQQLASAQTLVSEGLADRQSVVSQGGSVTFTFGSGEQSTLVLPDQAATLEDLAAAINADTRLGVRATLVNDGSDTPHRLLLTSAATGADAALTRISVSGDADDSLQALIGFDADQASPMQERVAAADALIDINGIVVSSPSNQIEHAIEGVTLALHETSAAQTLRITRSDDAGIAAVKGFVTAYNALQSTLSSLTRFDTENGAGGPLTGDSVARRVQSMMRETLGVDIGQGAVRTLSQTGIATDPASGRLTLDEEQLAQALAENLPDIQQLFTGENGLVRRVAEAAKSITAGDGMIKSAADGAERSAKLLDNDYTATSRRIDERMETYRLQFIALDKTVAQMSSISSYLTQQLAMLGNLNSSSGKS